MAPQGAVEVDRCCEQGEGVVVQGGPDGGVHLGGEREDAVGEGRDDVLLVGVEAGLVHHTQADVALPVSEDAGVEGGHHALAVPARRQQQRAQRDGGDVCQHPGVQGACTRSRGVEVVAPGRIAIGPCIGCAKWTCWIRRVHAWVTVRALRKTNHGSGRLTYQSQLRQHMHREVPRQMLSPPEKAVAASAVKSECIRREEDAATGADLLSWCTIYMGCRGAHLP